MAAVKGMESGDSVRQWTLWKQNLVPGYHQLKIRRKKCIYSASQKKCPLAKCNNWGPLEHNYNIPYTYKGYLGMPRYYRIRFVVPTVWPTASTSLSVQAKIIEN